MHTIFLNQACCINFVCWCWTANQIWNELP